MKTLLNNTSGATAVEYSLFLALISMAIVATATVMGTQLSLTVGEMALALSAQ